MILAELERTLFYLILFIFYTLFFTISLKQYKMLRITVSREACQKLVLRARIWQRRKRWYNRVAIGTHLPSAGSVFILRRTVRRQTNGRWSRVTTWVPKLHGWGDRKIRLVVLAVDTAQSCTLRSSETLASRKAHHSGRSYFRCSSHHSVASSRGLQYLITNMLMTLSCTLPLTNPQPRAHLPR